MSYFLLALFERINIVWVLLSNILPAVEQWLDGPYLSCVYSALRLWKNTFNFFRKIGMFHCVWYSCIENIFSRVYSRNTAWQIHCYKISFYCLLNFSRTNLSRTSSVTPVGMAFSAISCKIFLLIIGHCHFLHAMKKQPHLYLGLGWGGGRGLPLSTTTIYHFTFIAKQVHYFARDLDNWPSYEQ